MSRPLQFGLVLSGGSPTREGRATFVADLNRALSLVAGHFDSVWMIDHLQDGASDMLESFTTISYLAALHPRLRFGQTVICQSFRGPRLVRAVAANLGQQGMTALRIGHLAANAPARGFYEAIGGQLLEECLFHEEGIMLPEVVCEWAD